MFQASGFDSTTEHRIATLWNPRELEQNYQQLEKKMRTWLDRFHALEPEVAARESFLLGGTAIKHVVYDPFLPSEWVDGQARKQFLSAVDEVDQAGMRIWNSMWENAES